MWHLLETFIGLWGRSTMSLAFGLDEVVRSFVILKYRTRDFNSSASNCHPRSVVMYIDPPKQEIQAESNVIATVPVMISAMAMSSNQRVNRSIILTVKLCRRDSDNGLIMSVWIS